MSSALLVDLRARGLIFQIAGEDALADWLDGGSRTLYCGFDPTADSLHIASLVPLLMLVADSVLYALLAFYVDRIRPGKHRTASHPCFCMPWVGEHADEWSQSAAGGSPALAAAAAAHHSPTYSCVAVGAPAAQPAPRERAAARPRWTLRPQRAEREGWRPQRRL